jgi:hypothetical protein
MIIDKQRIAAVRTLEELGYTFTLAEGWAPATDVISCTAEADRLHALLVERADEIGGCVDGSSEDTELKSITDALQAYEAKRWPTGREAAGKG